VTVRGLVFRRYSDPLSGENAIAAVRASRGWTIEDCLFDEAGRTGVEIRDSDVLVTRSTFERNHVNAFMAWGPTGRAQNTADDDYTPITGLRITDVVMRGNHTTPDPLTGDRAEYVAKIWGTRGTLIDNIESRENNGPGIWFDTRNSDFVIRNSYFHDNRAVAGVSSRGRGIFIEINWAKGLIENNVVTGNSGAGITIANSQGVVIRGNLLADNAHCVAFISVRRKDGDDGQPLYPLRDITMTGNRCESWRGPAAMATIGSRFDAPGEMRISADGNVYRPTTDTVLVQWPRIGALHRLPELRAKLGWETAEPLR
jgi:parallel beta-helix repeat protein